MQTAIPEPTLVPPDTLDGLSEPMKSLFLDEHTLQFHADRIRVDGFTVLENALPTAYIAELRDRFDALMEHHRQSQPMNRGSNRYQMYLPFEPPFSEPRLYEHPVALRIIERVMGPQLSWSYLASDTPFPGSDYQQVHSDTRLLFPEANLSPPPYGIVVNVPLVAVTDENGPLEIWPGGTHYMPGPVDMKRLAERMVSLRLTINEGDMLIRDLRAWHRGTPNHGTRSRPNLALVYTRPWYRFEQQPPTLTRSQLESLSERAQAMLRYANIIEE